MTEWRFIKTEELEELLRTVVKGDMRIWDGQLQMYNGDAWQDIPYNSLQTEPN